MGASVANSTGTGARPVDHRLGHQRLRRPRSLDKRATIGLEPLGLLLRLYALGDHQHAEMPAQLDNAAGHRGIPRRARQARDQLAVELERIEFQVAQMGQGTVAGTEVIQGDAHPDRAQQLELLGGLFEVMHQAVLTDLHFQLAPLQPMSVDHLLQLACQVGMLNWLPLRLTLNTSSSSNVACHAWRWEATWW